jgi:hypothetical protein
VFGSAQPHFILITTRIALSRRLSGSGSAASRSWPRTF